MSIEVRDKTSPGGFEELEFRRETARTKGLLAESLEQLFPGQNLHFEETQREGEPRIALGYPRSEFEEASAAQKENLTPSARAYFCRDCGDWIEGAPRSESYDDHDPSGSTSYYLFCTICDSKIGEVTGIKS